tara:strand:- start:1682 stop:1864 length:183 start_codon:yes stop_codon:yes gene_type:complete
MKTNKLKVGIFYHVSLPINERLYWIGTFTKNLDGCEQVIKTIKSKGQKGLDAAIKFLNNF